MKTLVRNLIGDFDVHARKDGTVYRVHADGDLVGEVVIGARTIRANFRYAPEIEGLALGGKSKMWPGGGVKVTRGNLHLVRDAFKSVIGVHSRFRSVEHTLSLIDQAREDGTLDQILDDELVQLLERRATQVLARSRVSGSTEDSRLRVA